MEVPASTPPLSRFPLDNSTSYLIPEHPPPEPAPPSRWSAYSHAAAVWIRGPDPPTSVSFTPLFPAIQEWPSETFQRLVKRRRHQLLALVVYLLVWLVSFIVVIHYSRFADTVEGVAPMRLGCTSALWYVPSPPPPPRSSHDCPG